MLLLTDMIFGCVRFNRIAGIDNKFYQGKQRNSSSSLRSTVVQLPELSSIRRKITYNVQHGSPARGWLGCIVRPAATVVNCVYTIKITQ